LLSPLLFENPLYVAVVANASMDPSGESKLSFGGAVRLIMLLLLLLLLLLPCRPLPLMLVRKVTDGGRPGVIPPAAVSADAYSR